MINSSLERCDVFQKALSIKSSYLKAPSLFRSYHAVIAGHVQRYSMNQPILSSPNYLPSLKLSLIRREGPLISLSFK
ncbi:hypothetical protein BDY19DRAFT_769374 [Irpex rosettiformis]|uniref:Uncharacterized protein n=1 Tax=Irpex rosettiformis TaxID=378272 RepID=A0ACB8U890_9APHY|nr:hypothetical protein BDY19DRAFT_769374 [Irpex rosettiformis]